MNPFTRIGRGVKALGSMVFSGGRVRLWWTAFSGRTRYDYAAEVGDGRNNSIYGACVAWICRTFPEAPVKLSQINSSGDEIEQPNHALKLLLDTPNPYYPGELLWAATLADRTYKGNAYWLKVRSGAGRVVELYWVPEHMMEPKWPDDGSKFISFYEYTPGSDPIRCEVSEVVHFRWPQFDPRNPRKGLSPVQQLVREIFTDDEAANYTATMLRNVGVPPIILSPADPSASPTPEDLENTKQRYQDVTTGDNRGQALVMNGATKVDRIGYNPQEMDVRSLRRIPEERISALIGIPAAVVGLGTGLENTKVGATMAEMREQAYESNIIPTQRLMAAELRTQLLPDFGNVQKLKLEFDLSKVRVLQVDQDALHVRAREDLKSGLITLNTALQMIGEEPLSGKDGDVFYIPSNVTVTNPAELIATEPDPALTGPLPQNALPDPGVPAALASGKPPAKSMIEQTRLYADVDLVAALQEHALALSEPRFNGHSGA